MELSSTRDGEGVGGAKVNLETHIDLKLLLESLTYLTARHKLPFSPGKGRVVDEEVDRNSWLIHRNSGKWRSPGIRGDRLTDVDIGETRNDSNIPSRGLLCLDPLKPTEGENLGSAPGAQSTVWLQNSDRLIRSHRALIDASNGEPPEEVIVGEVKGLEHERDIGRRADIGRRDFFKYQVE